jgi:hypothetical protein
VTTRRTASSSGRKASRNHSGVAFLCGVAASGGATRCSRRTPRRSRRSRHRRRHRTPKRKLRACVICCASRMDQRRWRETLEALVTTIVVVASLRDRRTETCRAMGRAAQASDTQIGRDGRPTHLQGGPPPSALGDASGGRHELSLPRPVCPRCGSMLRLQLSRDSTAVARLSLTPKDLPHIRYETQGGIDPRQVLSMVRWGSLKKSRIIVRVHSCCSDSV